MTTSITDFLKDTQTVLTSVFSHYATMFKIKNSLKIDHKIYTSFNNALKHQSLSFVLDLDSKEFSQLYVKDESGELSTTLSDSDKMFIVEIMEIYLNRVGQDVSRLTKEMRQDWGRDYKNMIIEHSGYRDYFTSIDEEISGRTRGHIISYTLSTKNKKRAHPFPNS